jgi:hypothetical protein
MVAKSSAQQIERSFPEARAFLLTEIVGTDYPVKHLIEQARNKGHITRGKPGRGGGVVSSLDMAFLLAGTLAGETPQTATDAMHALAGLRTNVHYQETDQLAVDGLADNWWNHSFVEVIALLIEEWRKNPELGFLDMHFSVNQKPYLFGTVTWKNWPEDPDHFIQYGDTVAMKRSLSVNGRRSASASYDGETLMMVANWLEDRGGHN